ncbi:MAG: hypothetical protein GX640_10945 [Fibrobacter sp.]|nr:hypothetical protein [Fibrobacter sp.]
MSRYARFLVLLVVLQVVAQETASKAVVLEHAKKVYVDNQRKRLYWPLGKPFWVRLAESPDSTAKSYLLTSEIDSAKPESDVKLDGTTATDKGIRLDMSGKQALRWYNMVTGEKHNLRFYSDGDLPVCDIKLLNAPSYVSGTTSYFGKGLSFELHAEDKSSGVEQMYVSVNNGPYQPYTAALNFTTQMNYTVSFYAVDNVGNVSVPVKKHFAVDLTPPTTKAISEKSFTNSENKIILSRLQTISLIANDSLSGVKETFFKFDADVNFFPYKGALYLRNFKDGEHTLTFYSVDNVGNEEQKMSLSFIIDNLAPVPAVTLNGDQFEPKKGQFIVSPRTQLVATATDASSSVGSVEFSINNSAFTVYTNPFPVSAVPGRFIVNVRASDKLGNLSQPTTLILTVDAKAPHSAHSFAGPIYKTDYTTIITPATKITLSSLDDISGLKSIHYSYENDKTHTYSTPFSIPNEGSYILKYHGVDNVNNQEELQMIAVAVDNTPPVINETFSTPKLSASTEPVSQFQKSTMMFLQATDNLAGLNSIWYSFDGGKEFKYEKPIRLEKKGEHKVVIRAVDNVGNTSQKTIAFAIKE